MADPAFDAEKISALDVDNVAEGATKIKYLNNAVRELIASLQASFKIAHYNDTGKHTREYFHNTVTLTSAAATTPVNIVPDSDVTEDRKLYMVGFTTYVDGSTAWTGASNHVSIQGTDSVEFVRIKKAGLGANNITSLAGNLNGVNDGTDAATSNINFSNTSPFLKGEGGTANKGLQVKADDTAAGSDLYVTVWGFIY